MKECSYCGQCLGDTFEVCPNDGAALRSPFDGPALLDQRYQLLRRIGAGGSSSVYRARHLGLDRLVAVKILRGGTLTGANAQRFVTEAKALARLRHPAVVEVFDAGVEAERGLSYLVLELLEGESLAARLARLGPMSPAAALPILAVVAEALDTSHHLGILHRDLKPANVMLVDPPGQAPIVKVVDFGLAELMADLEVTPPLKESTGGGAFNMTKDQEVPRQVPVGTPGYLAPELLLGEPPTQASDLFSFGALAYQVLTGRKPDAVPELPSHGNPSLSSNFDAPLLAPLATLPRARPASASAAVASIQRGAEHAEDRVFFRRNLRRSVWLAPLLALTSSAVGVWLAGPLRPIERLTVDTRLAWSSSRAPDPRIVLVTLSEDTLRREPEPLSTRGEVTGRLLARCLEAGARGVAIDLLLPQSWSSSPGMSDLILRYSDRLVLAAYTPASGPVIGPEVLSGLTAAALEPEAARRLFGDVNLELDPDGRLRSLRPRRLDLGGQERLAFAARAAALLEPGVLEIDGLEDVILDSRIDWRSWSSIPWHEFEDVIATKPEHLRGRLVLVGAAFEGSGDGPYRVGGLKEPVPGYAVQALLLQSLLDRLETPLRSMGGTGWASFFMGLPLTSLWLLRRRLGWRPVALAGILAVCWSAICLLAPQFGWLLPMVPPLVALLPAIGLGWLVRRTRAAF